jgi:hypothetical protein
MGECRRDRGSRCKAYISRVTGEIHWSGEGIDEEPPEDIDDGSRYIAVPHKNKLDLGRSLVLRFVDEQLPRADSTVRDYFRRRGAYQRFKTLLAQAGQLDAWYRYEEAATEEALREWCAGNGVVVSSKASGG